MAARALFINCRLLQEACYVYYFCLVCQFVKIPKGLIIVPLHSEMSKQDIQLRLHAYKSKLFSTFGFVKRKKNDPDNVCRCLPTLLVLGGSLLLGIATHTFHLP